MKPVWRVAEAQAFDAQCVRRGVPGLVLMENAGLRAAQRILSLQLARGPVWVLCGPGNNGGDGYVVARQLRCAGHQVEVVAYGAEPKPGSDAQQMAQAWRAIGGEVRRELPRAPVPALLVDALLGTGAATPLRDDIARGVRDASQMRMQNALICALDLPTGLHPERGTLLGEQAIHADCTLTFGALKLGLRTPRGAELAGQIEVVDLGVPCNIDSAQVHELEAADIAQRLPRRGVGAHKNRNGHLLILGGSPGKEGAPQICAHAAVRAGAGLLTVASFRPDALHALSPTVMRAALAPSQPWAALRAVAASACVLGPGLGIDARAFAVMAEVLAECNLPMVLDADVFSYARGDAAKLRRAAPSVLTPHPAELARLLDVSVAEIEADRTASAAQAARLCAATVVLKGAHTVIASPSGALWLLPWALPALGVAGAGDALAGVIGALLAMGASADDAACAGVWLHAASAARVSGGADRGFDACELMTQLPEIVREQLSR